MGNLKCTQRAMARLRGVGIRGTASFTQCAQGVLVSVRVRGLPESDTGFYALHIHEGPDCGGTGFSDSGGHFNPEQVSHPSHAGDLPPLLGANGRAFLSVLTDRFRLGDILGRTVIIHSRPDDLHTQPSGGAGTKIACGVIRPVG